MCHLSPLLQMHLGIPQDMESDPDDEVNRFFIITWNCFFFVVPFCWLYCRRWRKYARCKYFVSVQHLRVKDASDCTFVYFFTTATSLLKWPHIVHEWKWQLFLISKDLFIVVSIPSPVEPITVPHLGLFFISIFLHLHIQQEFTISPSFLLTWAFHTGLWYLL